jgi:hypothetical protein
VKAHPGKAALRRVEDFGSAIRTKLGRGLAQDFPQSAVKSRAEPSASGGEYGCKNGDIAPQHKANECSL